MPIIAPYKCWRGRDDCLSMCSVEAPPGDVTQDQFETLEFDPVSFVCCGCIKVKDRDIPQDAYRICFKNDVVDDMSDNDDQDLSHLLYVISQSVAMISSRRVNKGRIDTLDPEGDMVEVETKQAAQ